MSNDFEKRIKKLEARVTEIEKAFAFKIWPFGKKRPKILTPPKALDVFSILVGLFCITGCSILAAIAFGTGSLFGGIFYASAAIWLSYLLVVSRSMRS